ncbi:glycosyltransferase 87 family protein [Streptomyces antibioticus]|uniref:glycosyltransferase 87 family protein n=1 Tax=Streptomyces antibioticus TaxID=1890 RepID=UPI0033DE26DD
MRTPATDRGRLLLLCLFAGAVTVFTATVPLLRDWFDLRVYHGTIDAWIHHGGRVYDYRVPGTPYGFTYPPFAAVAMLPMALVGLRTAIAAALLLDLAALAAVVRILAGPILRRHGWYGVALTACALALFEPLRDTFSFGQVNLVLLALVLTDCLLLATGRERLAGIGIGLAAAAAALIAPDASHFYWTRALWDTSRVGRLDYVSNQSLQGVLARLGVESRAVWALLAVLVLAVWVRRARRAAAAGDWPAAFALTGLTACLVSPVTWVHHLVWLLPSFALLLRAGHPRVAGALYGVLCTSVVWLWCDDASGVDGFLGSNTYTWITLGLLLWLPTGQEPSGRRTISRSAKAVMAAPSVAAPATASAAGQPGGRRAGAETSVAAGPAAAAAGGTWGPGLGRERSASSEPTGSTRPAAANPQSSNARASS